MDVGHFHVAGGPQVARALEVFAAADRVPVTRRIHALATVVRGGPKVLSPEKLLALLVHEHRVVRDGAAVVVQIVRAFRVGVVSAALRCQVTFVVDDEMILIEMAVLREKWTRVDLDQNHFVIYHKGYLATESGAD